MASFSTGDPDLLQNQLCHACRLVPPPFTRALAYGAYEGELREFIHLLKYQRIVPVARELGRRLATTLAAAYDSDAPPPRGMLVVPVPLFSRKQRKQGFNHSERIARAMLVAMRSTNPDAGLTLALSALERHRATDPQANLTPRQRRHNVRGAFAVRQPGRIAGRDVLLVDDIYTTGATVRAASLALLRGGAASVWVLTMARAQREGVALWDMPAEVSVEVSVEVSSIAEATVVGHPQPTVSGQPWESHV